MFNTPSKNPWNKVTKNTNQQDRNDPQKIMKLVEEEWDQTDTWLVKYGQSSERTSDWNCQSDIVR
jgi:endonuclease III